MRKFIIRPSPGDTANFLDLARVTIFEATSEDEKHPLDAILRPDGARWEAAEAGPQAIRMLFDDPQRISRIVLLFEEYSVARTQEFCLSWQSATDRSWRELRRQQFNFSPPQTVTEREDYAVSLEAVAVLRLEITPSQQGSARASLTRLQVA